MVCLFYSNLLLASSALILLAPVSAFTTGIVSRPSLITARTRTTKLYYTSADNSSDERRPKKTGVDQRFATGEMLDLIRREMSVIEQKIKWSIQMDDTDDVEDFLSDLEKLEARDPERVYGKAAYHLVKAAKDAEQDEAQCESTIIKSKKDMERARPHMPRFQLEGLWVGEFKYDKGPSSEQVVNVTYSGDTLIARVVAVSGDTDDDTRMCRRGQVAFKAHVGVSMETGKDELKPAEVFSAESRHNGPEKVSRFKGKGPVLGGLKFVDGQLTPMKDGFKFEWMPLRKEVTFSRPSPEETMRLLRNVLSEEDKLDNMKDHLQACFDKNIDAPTVDEHEDREDEPFRRIIPQHELDVMGAFE